MINGQTIHKGLGIVVHSSNLNAKQAIDKELSYRILLQKQEELRQEWCDMDFLLVDEVSMVSAELLAELDAALHYTCKEH